MDAEGPREEGNFGYLFFYLGKKELPAGGLPEDGRWRVKGAASLAGSVNAARRSA
jgi:hypothetical protein